MSGFIALFNTDGAPVDLHLLKQLTASLGFKGPHGQNTWAEGAIGLGHSLFETTHESKYENQPASLDGKVSITGDIRIDGREDLLNKLGLKDKIRLDKTPDSELVLHTYRKWGEDCLKHLLGDFAFALWDGNRQQLFCARDRFGMRQLYYSRVGNKLVISNSMHCQHQHPAITKNLNDQAIGDFLLLGDHMWVDQAQTAFADIQALLPAHSLSAKTNGIKIQRYWDLPTDTPKLRYRNDQAYVEHFNEIFKTAVSDRIRTPNPVIALSGGLDSSAIATTARQIQASGQQTFELHAVTVLFDSIHNSDERQYAQLVSQHLQVPTQYMDGGKYPFMSPPVQTTRPMELYQPALWLDFDHKASTLGPVMLTGEAGDNLLAPSTIWQTLKHLNPLSLFLTVRQLKALYGKRPPLGTGLRAKLDRITGKDTPALMPYPNWLNTEFEAEQGLQQRWSEAHSRRVPSSHSRCASLYESLLPLDWNTDDVYMHTPFTPPDKRDPFLDLRLVEFVAALPALPWMFNKHLLRTAMHKRLPAEVLTRRKTALGRIHSTLVEQADSNWDDNWRSSLELDRFIDREKVAAFDEEKYGVNEAYISLRPFLLNKWLSTS